MSDIVVRLEWVRMNDERMRMTEQGMRGILSSTKKGYVLCFTIFLLSNEFSLILRSVRLDIVADILSYQKLCSRLVPTMPTNF